mgnify:CR=1 FL=1
MKDPNKKASNEFKSIAASEVNEPIKPAKFPRSSPNLLVVDCIRFERIGELTIEPIIIKEIGKVA